MTQKTTIDDTIMQLFEVVKSKRAEFEKAEKETKQPWKTNCSITIGASATPTNLIVASDKTIRQVVTDLLIQREYAREACTYLEMEFDDKYQNHAYEDWFVDCKKRVAIVNLKQKNDSLKSLEERLQGIVSPEQKRAMELESIRKSLGV